MTNDERIAQQAVTILDALDLGIDDSTTIHLARDKSTGRVIVRIIGFDNATNDETIESVTGRNARDALAQACVVMAK